MNDRRVSSGSSRQSRFRALIRCAQWCDLCPRMSERTRVLSEVNGIIDSRVMFIAEAPGRFGADRTAIPLHGDKAGTNFEALLGTIGWSRSDVFVTNAVLCNPRHEDGANAPPTDDEIRNCSLLLAMTLEIVAPDVVVTLGATALRALAFISPHYYRLSSEVAELVPWAGVNLMPLYHPGQRAQVHRSFGAQRRDFFRLSKAVDPQKGLVRRATHEMPRQRRRLTSPRLADVISSLVAQTGPVSKFKLAKLLFLADLTAMNLAGDGLTGSVYLRQEDGPWPPEMDSALDLLHGTEVLTQTRGGRQFVLPITSARRGGSLSESDLDILVQVTRRYGHMTDFQIKVASYRTRPMRSILAAEKRGEPTNNRIVLDARQCKPTIQRLPS